VADYETSEDAERNLTFGGRVQAEFMDDRLRVGSTFVKEDGSALASGAKSNMVGIDVVGQISDTTEVRAEYAISDTTPGIDGAQAMLAEVIHTSEKLQAEAYFRQEDATAPRSRRNIKETASLILRDCARQKTIWSGVKTARACWPWRAPRLKCQLSVAGAVRGVFNEDTDQPNATSQLDARIGSAWRPRGEETVVFNRLDLNHTKNVRGETETKFVNNLAMNTMVADNWQLSTNYGVKHVRTDIAEQKFKSWSHLVGAETRFDLTEKIDIGLRGQLMTTSGLGTKEFSYGPSIGISPVKNVWINAGYNVQGFKDRDFEAAEYSRKGVYLQMRVKFDQHTAKGLLRRISPSNLVADNGTQTRSFANP